MCWRVGVWIQSPIAPEKHGGLVFNVQSIFTSDWGLLFGVWYPLSFPWDVLICIVFCLCPSDSHPLLVASSIPLLYCGGGNLSSDPWTISRVSQGTFKHFHCDTFCVFLVDYVWSGFLEMFTQHMDGTSAAPASLLVVQLSATQTAGESLKPKTQAIAEWYLAYYKLYYVLCQWRKGTSANPW